MDYCSYFKGKKITVMGLGLLGRGVGDTKFLAECGAELIVTDQKSEEELRPSLDALKGFPDITFRLGMHELEDFRNRDMILKAAGVPTDSPYIAEAIKNGVPIEMSASLFTKFSPSTAVGVTGTRGKSTVTHLLNEILLVVKKYVLLGGNVRGSVTLPLFKEVTEDSIAVFELDSWQLQGFGESEISPHIAVFTNFLPDHMNYYRGDMDRYLEDKANIFKYQSKNDVLVLGSQCAELVRGKYPNIQSKIIIANSYDISYELKLKGEHNRYNAACAAKAAEALGVSKDIIQQTISKFKGVPGRLELLRKYKGIEIYNDTTSTIPEATIAALNALGGNIVLIMGGSDKGLDMGSLLDEIPKYCKAVVLLKGTGTGKLQTARMNVKTITVDTLKEAVEKALAEAKDGDRVLLSPAFASFGMFKNEYDRGDQFAELVKNLK